MKLHDIFNSVT